MRTLFSFPPSTAAYAITCQFCHHQILRNGITTFVVPGHLRLVDAAVTARKQRGVAVVDFGQCNRRLTDQKMLEVVHQLTPGVRSDMAD